MHSLLQRSKVRALSSAGSEHLPYKQGVTGSNPVSPTKSLTLLRLFFIFLTDRQHTTEVQCIPNSFGRATGSNPVSPTTSPTDAGLFYCPISLQDPLDPIDSNPIAQKKKRTESYKTALFT